MIVGTIRLKIVLNECRNLKDKRRVLSSLKDKIRNNYNVSIAEIGELNMWNLTEMGIATVGNETKYVKDLLNSIVKSIELFPNIYIVEKEVETF